MKRICFYVAAAAIFFTACNNKKSAEQKAAEELQDNFKKMAEEIKENSGDIQKGKEELEKLTPLTMEELKALVPETLMGTKRSNYNATNAMGASFVSAEYKINDTTDVKLSMYDCGGPAGAGIYSMQYLGLGLGSIEQDSDEEYTKTISYGDGKAYEHCQKQRNDCTLTWFAGGRFLVTLDGDNVGADALKQAGKELKFK